MTAEEITNKSDQSRAKQAKPERGPRRLVRGALLILLLLAAVLGYATNLKLAQINAEQYRLLLQQDPMAKQDVDTAMQSAAARASTVKSSEANVERLIHANTANKELFHLAADTALGVYVSKAVRTPVIIGRDYGDSLEIVHGVAPDDRVIVNPSELITTGQPVQVQQADCTGARR